MKLPNNIETVILVVVDSLRADVTVPTIDRLGIDGVVCSSFYTPGASTPSSMPGFVQSRSPLDHDGYGLELPPKYPTLAERLSADGVSCAGWHSNVYISEQYGFNRGFELYRDLGSNDRNESGTTSWREVARRATEMFGIRQVGERVFEQIKRYGFVDPDPKVRAKQVFDKINIWLPSEPDGTRRFAYVHLMDTHLPYLPPDPYRNQIKAAPTQPKQVYDLWQNLISDPSQLSTEDVTALRGLYEAEALYTDSQLDELVTTLRERGLWDSTALVVTADHGELFRDREAPRNENMKHPDYLCYELTHTPLVIAGGSIPAATVEELVSGIDIAPTITQMFGIDPADEWQGTQIDAINREYVVSALAHAYGGGTGARVEKEATHVAVRDEAVSVLWWLDEKYDTEYYRRDCNGERRIEPDGSERFNRALGRAIEHSDRYVAVSDHGRTGNDISKRLRDLGYVE